MYLYVDSNRTVELVPIGRIFTASHEYTTVNLADKKVHDTHFGSTPRHLWWPKNPLDGESMFSEKFIDHVQAQFETIAKHIGKVLIDNNIKPWEESTNGFEVFGMDFMVESSQNVILLEVNDRLEYGCIGADALNGPFTADFQLFSKILYNRMLKGAVRSFQL
jgi:hypothetical protein